MPVVPRLYICPAETFRPVSVDLHRHRPSPVLGLRRRVGRSAGLGHGSDEGGATRALGRGRGTRPDSLAVVPLPVTDRETDHGVGAQTVTR